MRGKSQRGANPTLAFWLENVPRPFGVKTASSLVVARLPISLVTIQGRSRVLLQRALCCRRHHAQSPRDWGLGGHASGKKQIQTKQKATVSSAPNRPPGLGDSDNPTALRLSWALRAVVAANGQRDTGPAA